MNRVEKPGRYVGGEFGAVKKIPDSDDYTVCIVFPDLYEIAMSNQAVRILYQIINNRAGLHAERAFTPAADFCDALKTHSIPLYSLENGFELRDFDMIALTVGYELSFTNFLTTLDLARIPLHAADRGDDHPLIISGGPALTNPKPWSSFLDAVFIGESEGNIADNLLHLKHSRDNGENRETMRSMLGNLPGFWTQKNNNAQRQVWMGFASNKDSPPAMPVPSLQPVQDHGVIEIMRGCPNKCRFCHAGVFYRPFRQKPLKRIIEEAEYLATRCGYREITLSSLSSGDYRNLENLLTKLNSIFPDRKISFSLPSLRVNSLTLSLISQLGSVRKGSLTFAVETPGIEGQKAINKEVPAERVIAILQEAKREGWRSAKFYFMLGLPIPDDAEQIIHYLLHVQKETGIKLSINIGTFIPKPHTAFERSAQLSEKAALDLIKTIRDGLKSNRMIKISYHSPFTAFIEGILSRGDERAGELAYRAWLNGAAYDAWDDLMNRDAWREAIAAADWDVEAKTCSAMEGELPWSGIDLGITRAHLEQEKLRSGEAELTEACRTSCPDHCGVCNGNCSVQVPDDIPEQDMKVERKSEVLERKRLLLIFRKFVPAIYIGHLDLMNVFEKSLQRAGMHLEFTEGFNPKPRISFAQPLALGLYSEEEICSVNLLTTPESTAWELAAQINDSLPPGLEISSAFWIRAAEKGQKNLKVMSTFWGSQWCIRRFTPIDDVRINGMFQSLDSLILESCKKRGVRGDIQIERREGEWQITFRHRGTKNHNLKSIIEELIGQTPGSAGWEMTRTRCFAINPVNDDEPISYRELMENRTPVVPSGENSSQTLH